MKANLLFLFLFCWASIVFGQLPESFSDQLISEDWEMPMGITFDEEGSMYVWEKAGRVFIVDSTGNKIPTPLIDLNEEVGNWRDHGLLGFALDPDFLSNGHYYLLYSVDRHYLLNYGTSNYHPDSSSHHQASIGRLTRYTANPATNFQTTLENSRNILIGDQVDNGFPLYHESHGVGSLVFGKDGTLLISCGDGNSNGGADIGGDEFSSYASQALADNIIDEDEDIGSFKSQYLGSLSGKILRINPENGNGIPSNPFYDSAEPKSAKSRVWATGFRNPFRISLIENSGSHNPEDGNPGVLYVGDVGASHWEELNVVDQGGLNFGWPLKEGLFQFWDFWNADHPANQLAPNPLFDGENCTQEYFDFKDLFAEARLTDQAFFPNPCDATQPIPESVGPRMETIPVLTWGHNEWNLPSKAFIGIYNEDGSLEAIDITSSESPVDSDIFDGNSSIAGTVYNGDNFPEEYQGKYFHADYSGWIKIMHFDENHVLQKVEPFYDDAQQIIHLIEHPKDGCLYYLSFKNGGSIHKICYGGNPPPIAIAKADTIYGPSPLTVNFDASESYDPFGLPISFLWEFGDGATSELSNPSHEFTTVDDSPTPFEVSLTVTDSLGLSTKKTLTISLNNTPPVVEIMNPKDGSFYAMNGNTTYQLEAEVEDLEQEDLEYEWQTFLHHNSHFHPEEPSFEINPKTVISPVGCEEDATYWFRIQLTVRDGAGLETVKESLIYPYCGDSFFELINLVGGATEQSVELSWDINSEEEVVQYEVQRSPFFETISVLESTGIGSYNFTDSEPIFGDNYYRIKALRSDGVFEYSETVKLAFPPKPEIIIYPNPAKGQVYIEMKKAQSEEVEFELFDATGKKVLETSWSSEEGKEFKGSALTFNLANGIYFFRLKDGDLEETGRLVVIN